jgi:phosphinothricin acetyltransferase
VNAPDPAQVVIRFATEADYPHLRDIFNTEVEQATSSWEWSALSHQAWQHWVDNHTRHPYVLLVAEVGQQIAGFAGYGVFRAKAGYVTTVEDSVFIQKSFRGHGLGRRLLAALIDQARARGVHAMVAAVTRGNVASLGLHTALGFAEVGRLPQIGHKFGRWMDLCLLQIILDDRPTPSSL